MTKPNFFIVGAPKCGTTALYEYLSCHPQIFMAARKEPNFFGRDRRWVTHKPSTREEYLALFADSSQCDFRGEASTLYLQSKTAAREIHDFSPAAKIIVMVRNPIEMMHSLHAQCLLNSDEDIDDFTEALAAEADRSQGKRIPGMASDVDRLLYRHCAHFSEQIERYLRVFGRKQVHIIVNEDLRADPAAVYADVIKFLGASDHALSAYPHINESRRLRSPTTGKLIKRLRTTPPVVGLARTLLPKPIRRTIAKSAVAFHQHLNHIPYARPPLPPELERKLQEEFTPEVERLGELLNRDLSHWVKPQEKKHGQQTSTPRATTE